MALLSSLLATSHPSAAVSYPGQEGDILDAGIDEASGREQSQHDHGRDHCGREQREPVRRLRRKPYGHQRTGQH
jgi:hypothetical protein